MTPTLRRLLVALLALVLLARTTWLLWLAWPFTSDDALISVRYAQHLAAGQGLVWNVGEAPLEGYSNFLSVLVAGAAVRLHLPPELVLKTVGALAVLGALVLVYRLARLWVNPLLALVPVAVLSSLRGLALWGVSGMETPLYLAAVLLAIICDFRNRPIAAGLAVALAGMVRPEGPVIGIAIGLGFLATRDRRALGRFSAAASVPYGLYFAWRLSVFRRPFPNPVYCKFGHADNPWDVPSGLILIAVACAILLLRCRLDRRHVVALSLTVLYLLVLYGVDPIVTAHHRLDLAAAAVLLTVTIATLLSQAGRWQRAIATATVAVALLWPVGPAVGRIASRYASRNAVRAEVADYLAPRLGPGDGLVLTDVGLIGTRVETRIFDALCLNSAEMTQPPINRDSTRYAAWVLDQRPAAVVLTSRRLSSPPGGPIPADPGFAAYQHARRSG